MSYPSDRFVGTVTKTIDSRNIRYWYLCACGQWRGRNASFRCACGEPPPSANNPRSKYSRNRRVFKRLQRAGWLS